MQLEAVSFKAVGSAIRKLAMSLNWCQTKTVHDVVLSGGDHQGDALQSNEITGVLKHAKKTICRLTPPTSRRRKGLTTPTVADHLSIATDVQMTQPQVA